MKSLFLGRLAAFASLMFLAAVVVAFPSRAADLGGNCCADIEERVAELEATAARKDTRRVGVTVYGQVSKAMLWDGSSANDGRVVDNPHSGTRFGLTGEGKIDSKTQVGYRIEVGAGGDNGSGVTMRHAHLWIAGTVGKLTLGLASTATDGISEIMVANSNLANLPSAIYGVTVDGGRKNLVRFDTVTMGGLSGSISYAGDDTFEAAARFAQEANGFRFSAGIGYADEAANVARVSGSASLMHVQSGLFAGITAGRLKVGSDVAKAAHVTLGVEQRWNNLGKSTLYGEIGRLSVNDASGNGWGLGAVQSIDAVAADLFASFRRLDDADVSVVMVGSRVRF